MRIRCVGHDRQPAARLGLRILTWLALVTLVTLLCPIAAPQVALAEGGPPPDETRTAFFDLPLRFIANYGQASPEVHFSVKGAGHNLFFTSDQVVLRTTQTAGLPGQPAGNLIRLRFPGANRQPTVEGLARLPGNANFFIGADQDEWRLDVPTYAAVAYRDLYPGVDMTYSGSQGRLKSEFILDAGVNPGIIRLAYTGVEGAHRLPDGALVLETRLGELIEEAPLIYQEAGGVRTEISGRYVVQDAGPSFVLIGFHIPQYDPDLPLVIDPALGYSTYLGGSGRDSGSDVAVDGVGNAYVVGDTPSEDFPVTGNALSDTLGGNSDAFVTQIVRSGDTFIYGYSTYLGGSGDDFGNGIAVNADGDVTLTGQTTSLDFPTHLAPQPALAGGSDAFVTRIISASGAYTFSYSTYLGGTAMEYGSDVALDSGDNTWVTGNTSSPNFYTTAGAIQRTYAGGNVVKGGDAFVTQLVAGSGTYTYGYSTFIGGSGIDFGTDIALSSSDDIYITGETWSTNFPTFKPLATKLGDSYDYDAFATRLISASGTYTYGYSTYLGGTAYDTGSSIDVDSNGAAYVAGSTRSIDMFTSSNAIQPNFNGGEWDAFVTQIVSSGSNPAYGYASYLGGGLTDLGNGIAVAGVGSFHVTGQTRSSNFPTTAGAISNTLRGTSDVFAVHVITASGVYTYDFATYLGGSGEDAGQGVAAGHAADAYLTGWTQSSDFPLHKAVDTSLGGEQDAFVARLGWTGLYLSKSVNRGLAMPGDAISFQLTYYNDSAGPATNVVITDTLPVSLTQVSYTSSGALITPTGTTSYTWQVADLAQGEGGTITIAGTVITGTTIGSVLTNTACITATVSDPYSGDNCDSARVIIGRAFYLPLIFKN